MGFEIKPSGEYRVSKSGQTANGIADPVTMYFAEASQHELLTAEQEVELGQQIQAGVAIDYSLRLPEDFGGSKRQRAAAEATLATAREALDTMVLSNLRLVSLVAGKFAWSSLGYDELLHDGVLGLVHAAKKFDPDRGLKYSNYATWWIRKYIGKSISDTARLIRLPHSTEVELSTIRRKQRETPGRPLTDICQEMGVRQERIELSMQFTRPTVSLDSPLDREAGIHDDGETLYNTVRLANTDGEPTVLDALSAQAGHTYVLEAIRVSRRMARALEPRFGLDAGRVAHIIRSIVLEGGDEEELSKEMKLAPEEITEVKAEGLSYLRSMGEQTVRTLVGQDFDLEPAQLARAG